METTATFTKTDIETVYAARKDRFVHPEGSFDNGGRWYPSKNELFHGCLQVRSPSRSWPYSYLTAARTRKHVAGLAAHNPAYFARCLAEAKAALERVQSN